jgi:DNA (cytosine-5)-methyltransferase 1
MAHHGRNDAASVWAGHLIVNTLTASDGGVDDNDARAGRLVICATGDRTHALTSEGCDAGEDGTGRGTPIVIAATLTAGTASPCVSAPGRRNEDDVNLVCFDPDAGGDQTSSGAFEAGTGITPTLQGGRPPAVGQATASGADVRRLTPLECERLQGAPDGWTAGQSDSARYRQLGNAVAVPVFDWVATQLARVDSAIRRGEAA